MRGGTVGVGVTGDEVAAALKSGSGDDDRSSISDEDEND